VGTQAHVLEEFDGLAACCKSLLLQSCESYSIFQKKRKKDGNIKGGGWGIAHLGQHLAPHVDGLKITKMFTIASHYLNKS
jgi:hypothetical protein